jgi:uncharacterized protein (DUF486 family)
MNIFKTVILWLLLNVLIVIAMQIALFAQTTDENKKDNMFEIIITSQFWASMEWIFVIPAQRLGILLFNPAQLAMSSYVFNFLSQIGSNAFWLKLPTLIDDYAGMGLILLGMYVAKFKVFH